MGDTHLLWFFIWESQIIVIPCYSSLFIYHHNSSYLCIYNIYIYIWYPPLLRSTSEHFDILSLHVYIYIYMYIYIYVHICIRVIFFKDVLWVVAVHTIKTSWKQKNIFDDSLGENPWEKKTPRENQQKTIFGDSLGKLYWQNQKNLEKTKKTKNQNFSENVWSEAHVCFFFVLPSFFCFFLVLTLKKLKKLKVFLVFWIKWWLKCEKQKNSRFFLVLGCLWL